MTRIFTKKELLNFNGQDGKPAYVAYKGKVYDVSTYFYNGEHAGIKAGKNLTHIFSQSPHSETIFMRFPVVGTYKEE